MKVWDFEQNEQINDYMRKDNKVASLGDFVRGGFYQGSPLSADQGLRIDFLQDVPMRISGEGTEFMDYYMMILEANLAHEFEGGDTARLIDFYFCESSSSFKNQLVEGRWLEETSFIDSALGGIPALSIENAQAYILLIPHKYVLVASPGLNLKAWKPRASSAYARRVHNLTLEMLKRISWVEPIDQNSDEYKSWKAHLLALIEDARELERQSQVR